MYIKKYTQCLRTTHSSCRTSGYNVTAMNVTERYKKNMLHWKNSFLCKGNENKS